MVCAGGDEDAVRTMIADSTEGIELVAVSGAACIARPPCGSLSFDTRSTEPRGRTYFSCWRAGCESSALSPTFRPLQVDGTTPLWIASARGHRGIVDLLLASGADVSAVHVGAWEVLELSCCLVPGEGGFPGLDLWPCDDPRPQSTTGETPLHVAAKNDHAPVEIVVALLNGRAAVDAVRVRVSLPLWSRR